MPPEETPVPVAEVLEVVTPRGTFTVVQSITLGELLITYSVLLLVAFLALKWLLESVWRRGGR